MIGVCCEIDYKP